MKTAFICFLIFCGFFLKAQVVFCPSGAQWNYLFSGTIWSPTVSHNETIVYVKDSIENNETIKLLVHNRSAANCSQWIKRTWIKQRGDTLYYRNKFTHEKWVILYNFATPSGQTWQSRVIDHPFLGDTVFTTTVLAVGAIVENGFTLRQMTVSVSPGSAYPRVITERFGARSFMFLYNTRQSSSCDGDVFIEYLCYSDSAFGTKQFTEKECQHNNPLSFGDDETIKFSLTGFPNPTKSGFNLNYSAQNTLPVNIELKDQIGKTVFSTTSKLNESEHYIPLEDLSNGIYIIQVKQNDKIIHQAKVVKTN